MDAKNSILCEKVAEVRTVRGKGQGLFATQNIEIGQLILREKPLIVMPDEIFALDDMDRLERWLDRALNKLSAADRQIFFNLSDCRSCDETKTGMGIFFTNDMNFSHNSAALFPTIAKSNHSCYPNADFISRQDLNVQDLVAMRLIKKDEEICISYLPAAAEGSDVRDIRQGYIRKWYGFACKCEICILTGLELEQNDDLRRLLSEMQTLDSLDTLSLSRWEVLLDGLSNIGSKLPYLETICKNVFDKSLEGGNFKLATKSFASGYVCSSIMGMEDNEWDFVLASTAVTIDGRIYMFPLA